MSPIRFAQFAETMFSRSSSLTRVRKKKPTFSRGHARRVAVGGVTPCRHIAFYRGVVWQFQPAVVVLYLPVSLRIKVAETPRLRVKLCTLQSTPRKAQTPTDRCGTR